MEAHALDISAHNPAAVLFEQNQLSTWDTIYYKDDFSI